MKMTPNKTGGKVLAACLAALQLLTLAAPVVPVHVFTRARAVVDPLTAR